VTGLLCPGQGSQFVGMGRDLALAFPEARATFEEADEALGFSLSGLCWEGPEEELTRTLNAQPAILVHTVAVWRVMAARAPAEIEMAAGHSLGEFSAHVAAGTLRFADAVRTVRLRGELMFAAGTQRPGGMAAVLGLADAAAETVCETASSVDARVVPANYNSPGQIVVSGDTAALGRLEPLARQAGAKRVVSLNVSGAFHSPLMEPAVPGLREALEALSLQDPSFPIVSNVTATPVMTGAEARDLLVRQLTAPVRWAQSVMAMRGSGIERFLEIGPNNVLTGLLRRIDRSATGRAVGSADELTTYLAENG